MFQEFFRGLIGQIVLIETKNNLVIKGTLAGVDEFLNYDLDETEFMNPGDFPQLSPQKRMFVRGSSVRYVHLNPEAVDLERVHFLTHSLGKGDNGKKGKPKIQKKGHMH